MAQQGPKTNQLQSVRTTFKIIESLKRNTAESVSTLAEQLELPKSTVHSHLTTLNQLGYLINEDGTYRLSYRLVHLGRTIEQSHELRRIVSPTVETLAAETGEQAYFAVEENGLATNIVVAEGERSIRKQFLPGGQARMTNTATGKAILAHLLPERVDEIVQRWGMPQAAPGTITDETELATELETIRTDGIAYAREESVKGLLEIAIPILDDDGHPHGALEIAGPTKRLDDDDYRHELVDEIETAGNEIEVNLSIR
ncbi:IclR family transcriptional regulator [Natrinema pellirubrum DSM 15624]|uniref:Transcriptional regulator n=1 Tax=Natrinema pellirubrum (strain DSM 15624 / CIP 106293 / JCM 10476 / NCIMB 786 / 157) TaxID=797303 RepID=L0JM36_NATP1|nr:IclR family transcriptional regulator [Natrinema pellirubrum]AGB31652.1 transcriptional regulator [Natrinema pellirubrum DSM 15624]ELY73021.1 IclR family transcriptional regulator [Natrinema pellirubrum DSM 15624]